MCVCKKGELKLDLFNNEFSLVTLDYAQNESGIQATDIWFMITFTQRNNYPGEKINCIIEDGSVCFTPSEVSLLKQKFEDFRKWYDATYDELGRLKNTPDIDEDLEFDRGDISLSEENNEEEVTKSKEEDDTSDADVLPIDNLDKNDNKEKQTKKRASNRKKMEENFFRIKKLEEENIRLENLAKAAKTESERLRINDEIAKNNASLNSVYALSATLASESRLTGEKEKAFFDEAVTQFQEASKEKESIKIELEQLKTELKKEIDSLDEATSTKFATAFNDLQSSISPQEYNATPSNDVDKNINFENKESEPLAPAVPQTQDSLAQTPASLLDASPVPFSPPSAIEEYKIEKGEEYREPSEAKNAGKNAEGERSNDGFNENIEDSKSALKDNRESTAGLPLNDNYSKIVSDNPVPPIRTETPPARDINNYPDSHAEEFNNTTNNIKELLTRIHDTSTKYVEKAKEEVAYTQKINEFLSQSSVVHEGDNFASEYANHTLTSVTLIMEDAKNLSETTNLYLAKSEDRLKGISVMNSIANDCKETTNAIKNLDSLYEADKINEHVGYCYRNLTDKIANKVSEFETFKADFLSKNNSLERIIRLDDFMSDYQNTADIAKTFEYAANHSYYQELISDAAKNNKSIVSLVDDSNKLRDDVTKNGFAKEQIYFNYIYDITSTENIGDFKIENISKMFVTIAPEVVATDVVKAFNEHEFDGLIKKNDTKYDYKSSFMSSFIERSNSNGTALSILDNAKIEKESAEYVVSLCEKQVDVIKSAFAEHKQFFDDAVNKNLNLTPEMREKIISQNAEIAAEKLRKILTDIEDQKFTAKRLILDNQYTIDLNKEKKSSNPNKQAELINLASKRDAESAALVDEHNLKLKNIDNVVDKVLSIRRDPNSIKSIGDGTNLKNFNSDELLAADSAENSENSDKNLAVVEKSATTNNKKNISIAPDEAIKISENDEIAEDDALVVQNLIKTGEEVADNVDNIFKIGASNNLLNDTENAIMSKAVDYHWAMLHSFAESAGTIAINSLTNVTREAFVGTELYSGFYTLAPFVSVPVSIIVNASLKHAAEYYSRDIASMFGSKENRDALRALFNARDMSHVNMRNIKPSDLDALFAKSEVVGLGKFSQLSPRQLKALLKNNGNNEALQGAVANLLNQRKMKDMRRASGKSKMRISKLFRRAKNQFFNGTEAGEGYEDIKRLYMYGKKTFSTAYKVTAFVGRKLMSFNNWTRNKKIKRLENKISKGKNIAKNTKKLNKLNRRKDRVERISNKFNHIRGRYTLGGLKQRAQAKVRKALREKFGEKLLFKVASKIATKIASVVVGLGHVLIWVVLIIILLYLILALFDMALNLLKAPIADAADRYDANETFVLQGYHRLYYNEADYDPLNQVWYEAITVDAFDTKKPENDEGYTNPATGRPYKITEYGVNGTDKGYSNFYTSDGYYLMPTDDGYGFGINNAKTILAMADIKLQNSGIGGDGVDEPGVDWSSTKYNNYIAKLFEETHYCGTRDSELYSCTYGCTEYNWYCNDSTCDDNLSGAQIMTNIPSFKNDTYSCETPPGGWSYCDGCVCYYSEAASKNVWYCPGHAISPASGSKSSILWGKEQTISYEHKLTSYDTIATANAYIDNHTYYSNGNLYSNKYFDYSENKYKDQVIAASVRDENNNLHCIVIPTSYIDYAYHNFNGETVKCYKCTNLTNNDSIESNYVTITKKVWNWNTLNYESVIYYVYVPMTSVEGCSHTVSETITGYYTSYCEGHTSSVCTGHRKLEVAGIVCFAQDDINSLENTAIEEARRDRDASWNIYVTVFDNVESKYWSEQNQMNWLYKDDDGYFIIQLVNERIFTDCVRCGEVVMDTSHCLNCNEPNTDNWSDYNLGITIASPNIIKPYGKLDFSLYDKDYGGNGIYGCKVTGSALTGYTVDINSFWNKVDKDFDDVLNTKK